MSKSNPLVGTWKLISCENFAPDGTVTFPFDKDPVGYIFYREDGYMSVEMMKPHRKEFKKEDMWMGTQEEDSAAMKSYLGYAGKYTVEDNTVTHHIEVCSFPNWSGTDETRKFEIQNDVLTLITPPTSYWGTVQTGHVKWKRIA